MQPRAACASPLATEVNHDASCSLQSDGAACAGVLALGCRCHLLNPVVPSYRVSRVWTRWRLRGALGELEDPLVFVRIVSQRAFQEGGDHVLAPGGASWQP